MFMHPSLRKGVITDQSSVPFINYPDSVFIQDDQFLPEYSQDIPFQYLNQDQPRLESAFNYHQDFNRVSPPSSVPSSPSSSPASSVSHFAVNTAVATGYPTVFDGSCNFEAPSMTPASSYNPSIHVQQSDSPQPQSYIPQYHPQQFVYDNSPMLTTQQYSLNNNGWENHLQLGNNLPRASHQFNSHTSHLQTPNSSSGRSPRNSYQHYSAHNSAPTKPLPTPVHTPVQHSFLTPQYQKNDLSSHDAGQFVPDQQQQSQSQHQHQTSDYSLAPSVSSVSHNSPVTPQTGFEDVEDISRPVPNEYTSSNGLPLGIPKLNRTITDAYQDELYNPSMQTPQLPNQPAHPQGILSPLHHNLVANRLQAANQGHLSARVQSPVGSIHRERSPFRQNSPLAAEYDHETFQQQPTVTSVPTSQPGMGMRQTQMESKTISPKDAVLSDFNDAEDHATSLYPQSDFNFGDALGLRQDNTFQPAPAFPSMDSFPTQFNQAPGTSQPFTFKQPQQQSRRQSQQQQNSLLHQTPDFPASLPRFESTGNDAYSNDMISPTLSKHEITRPQDTAADGGTYTCTYHGCTQRFESPVKLQKHKREAHRQTTPGGHLVARDVSSRNSQAGPHRCERVNPSTGKPCNSVFSRPYDLTRHEDTIHNARKQKVRCHLCTEEKTFSRNDALTRHMRVVHPEVDWPGKQRRRGRE
ncbi:hypothetical protein BDW59DRAFT_111574 [Aspergillus cavernicola]|uniref:C2H2-type domain-containing protein n=1 Tax=Aspergillus cavernicola TaxID=176166 RepID=A0ABR4I0K3_9EURO